MTEGAAVATIFGIIAGIVGGVAALAFAPKPPWLDRIWLWMIGAAFVLWVPLWIIFQIQDHGWKAFAAWAIGLFVLGAIKAWPVSGGSSRS